MEGIKLRDKYTLVSGKDLKCGNCGDCCRVYSKVDLHITDIFRIAEYLGVSPERFFKEHCKVIENGEDTATFALNVQGGCKFRADGRCSIYPVRPDMCAFYPYSHTCLHLSQAQKKEMADHTTCFVHGLDDDLIIAPDIERMVDSRIFYMIKEAYLAMSGGRFDEKTARSFHESGMARVKNKAMREIVHRQILNEMKKLAPVDEKSGQPLLTGDEVTEIYNSIRLR